MFDRWIRRFKSKYLLTYARLRSELPESLEPSLRNPNLVALVVTELSMAELHGVESLKLMLGATVAVVAGAASWTVEILEPPESLEALGGSDQAQGNNPERNVFFGLYGGMNVSQLLSLATGKFFRPVPNRAEEACMESLSLPSVLRRRKAPSAGADEADERGLMSCTTRVHAGRP